MPPDDSMAQTAGELLANGFLEPRTVNPDLLAQRLIPLLALGEGLLAAGAGLLGVGLLQAPPDTLLAMALTGPSVTLLLILCGGYGLKTLLRPWRALPWLALSVVLAGTFLHLTLVAGDFADHTYVLGWWMICALALLGAGRFLVADQLQRLVKNGRLAHRVVLLSASGEAVDHLAMSRAIAAQAGLPVRLNPIALDASSPEAVERLVPQMRALGAQEILVLPPQDPHESAWLKAIAPALDSQACPSRLVLTPDQRNGSLLTAPLGLALRPGQRAAKRALDLVGGSFLLVLLTPLMLLTMAAIRLDSPGPVFFRQQRRGQNGRVFDLLKFRSMRHDRADPLAERLTLRRDPRVTRVGIWIRRTSVDELPQLLNVLKGDMSLVGPRPHPLKAKAGGRSYEEVVPFYGRRYCVKPGLTGFAQVSGLRGNTDTEDKLIRRVEFDLRYIRNWSMGLDLWILIQTPLKCLFDENAY